MVPVGHYARAIDKTRSDPYEGEAWQCTMDDERWTSRSKNGLVISIPWKMMKVNCELPDGWAIGYYNSQMWVYREPLRKAGLEEEFKRRIGKKPAETTPGAVGEA
jgi:hypothetical protein